MPTSAVSPNSQPNATGSHPIDAPLALMRRCQHRYSSVWDYTAIFVKQERIGRKLLPQTSMLLKVRERPFSVYFGWLEPDAGKEAIFVQGQNDGKIVTHTTGIIKALTGTMKVDPQSSLARRGNKHSITEAGIGNMIHKLLIRWEYERQFHDTEVTIGHVKINGRPCFLITTIHPQPDTGRYMFHTLKVYVDKDLELPVRLEGYGYPRVPGYEAGELLESYTYLDVVLNPGLTDMDFSPENPQYNFSRF